MRSQTADCSIHPCLAPSSPRPSVTSFRGYIHSKLTTSFPVTMHMMVMFSPWRTTVCTAFTETLMDDTGGERVA